ncbi:acyltransferase family protein [Clavibacter michiganensis]|uniref:acyltransferase family protein n=1 Tax=Clavibacter michiganensis TaxID=28447 RepID=UPI0005BE1398|nr:acyltransferase family protein [Clavibacter michiganensis]
MTAERIAAGTDAPTRPSTRRADIQGLRAVAVLAVVLFHAGLPLPGGFLGVDVFFVVSGHVITQVLLREFAATGGIRLGRFLGRRFRRLAPALVTVLLVTLVASALIQSPLVGETTSRTALGGLAGVANVVIYRTTGGYFEPAAASNPLLHIWSLSVEEQFYLVFPVLLLAVLLVARRSRARALPAAVLLGITVASALVAMAAAAGIDLPGPQFPTSFYSPVTRAWEFGVGALVAMVPAARLMRSPRVAVAVHVLGAGLLVVSLVAIDASVRGPGPWTLLPVAATALLLLAGAHASGPVAAVLRSTPSVRLGDISYSWYLWHWPAIVLTSALIPDSTPAKALAALAALVPAAMSYRWIERPIREAPVRTRWGTPRLAAALLVPAVLVVGTVGVASDRGWGIPEVQAIHARHTGWDACMAFATLGDGSAADLDPARCTWDAEATGRPVYLVGDSNASQFSEAVIAASGSLGRPTSMRTAAACPFVDVHRQVGATLEAPDRACRAYYEDTLAWLEGAPAGTVVIASTEGYWSGGEAAIGSTPQDVSRDVTARSTALTSGLTRTTTALRDAGHDVVLVQSVPHPVLSGHRDVPESCSVLALASRTCVLSVPRAEIDAVQAPSRATLEQVAESTGATVLDLRDSFCDASTCSMDRDGELLYQDAMHLTVEASRSFTPRFADALAPSTP